MSWERAEPGPPNPLAWSFPLVRLAGTRFRVHFSFAVYALVVVLRAAFGPTGSDLGLRVVAECVGALLVLVLLRETVRAIVVRAAGGSARRCSAISRRWPWSAIAPGSNGRCSTGTRRRSASTRHSVRG